jgi:hypothetical protein
VQSFFFVDKKKGVVRIVMAGLVRYEFLCCMGVGTVYVNTFLKKKFSPKICPPFVCVWYNHIFIGKRVNLFFTWSPSLFGDQETQKQFGPLISFFSHLVPL